MESRTMQEVLDWMRTTDLAEVSYRRGEDGLELRLESALPQVPSIMPSCSLVPVTSPEVGVFRWSKPGAPRRADKGAVVAEGEALGLVEVGTRKQNVLAPVAGRLTSVLIEEGKAVEYGQPLFFIRPE